MYLSISNGLNPRSRISHVRVKLKKKKKLFDEMGHQLDFENNTANKPSM